jgi:predicted nucleic acid-binding protein
VAQLIAIYDACVLYPAPLRDFLMQLALTDLFRAKWTHRIHDEWIRNLLANRPDLKKAQLEKTRQLMNSATRDGLVEGYDALIDSVKLPDEDDRHVLAAAIHTHANLIVTFNLKDFPAKVLHSHKIEAIHPDDFVMRLIKMDSVSVCEAARAHRARLRNPPKSVDEYLSTLSEQRLIKGVEYLRTNRGVI